MLRRRRRILLPPFYLKPLPTSSHTLYVLILAHAPVSHLQPTHSLQEQSAAWEKVTCEVKVGPVGAGTWGGMGT